MYTVQRLLQKLQINRTQYRNLFSDTGTSNKEPTNFCHIKRSDIRKKILQYDIELTNVIFLAWKILITVLAHPGLENTSLLLRTNRRAERSLSFCLCACICLSKIISSELHVRSLPILGMLSMRAGHRRRRARVQIAVATLSGNSLRQTVYTHCASVHQAAKLVAALLRVAGVTAGLAESNDSLPPGLWLTSPAGWLPRTGISSGTLRSVIEYGLLSGLSGLQSLSPIKTDSRCVVIW